MYPVPFTVRAPYARVRHASSVAIESRKRRFGVPDSFSIPEYHSGYLQFYFTREFSVFRDDLHYNINNEELFFSRVQSGLCLVIDTDIEQIVNNVVQFDFTLVPESRMEDALLLARKINSYAPYVNFWSFSWFDDWAQSTEMIDPREESDPENPNEEKLILISEFPGYEDLLPKESSYSQGRFSIARREFFLGMDTSTILSTNTPSGLINPFTNHPLLAEYLIDDQLNQMYQEGLLPIYAIPIYDRKSASLAMRFLRRVFRATQVIDLLLDRLVALQEVTS